MVSKQCARKLSLAGSLILGFVVGYEAVGSGVAAMSISNLNLSRSHDSVTRTFIQMVRLGETEQTLSPCMSKQLDAAARDALLSEEAELINGLTVDAKSAGLAPPLDVAAARLTLRKSAEHSRTGGVGRSEASSSQRTMALAGWPRNSESILHEALLRNDGACGR